MSKGGLKECPGPTCLGGYRQVSEFYRNRARADGLSSQCKRCQSEYTSRPEVRERVNAVTSEWQRTNPEKTAARVRRWQQANPGQARAIKKRYEDSEKRPCEVDGCTAKALSHTGSALCKLHQNRVYTHGDPHTVLPPASGPDHPRWAGAEVGYSGMHARIRSARGRAADNPCTECGGRGQEWSYNYSCPDERMGWAGDSICPYSINVNMYRPLCKPCHESFDAQIRRQRKTVSA